LEAALDRGAHLPAPLRRSLVDGHSLGRLPARGSLEALRADVERQVRAVRDVERTDANARRALPRARVAVPRRTHDRRGHAPARVRRRRYLWQGAAESERRAPAHRAAVEIRVQEHQVDRPYPLHGPPTANELEHGGAAGVRLLLERQPGSRSPALESGVREALGRRSLRCADPDADVQRLRRPGREPLHGSRSPQEFLTACGRLWLTQRSVVIVKIAIWAGCLAPFGLLVLQAFGYFGGLGANDVETVLNVCGKTGLNLFLLT